MRRNHLTRVSSGCLLCLLSLLAGCGFNMASHDMQAKYERTVQLSAALARGSLFAAETYDGFITINGADVGDCNLTATIFARASTEENARKLAEKTKVRLERFGHKLTLKVDKPILWRNQFVGVGLDAQVPCQTNLELVAHNGAIGIASMASRINATTYNGDATVEELSGSAVLTTHNGSITCKEISGVARPTTYNGSIRIYCSEAARSACDISAATFNGGIEFAAPPDFSATVEASTQNGSVNAELPIAISSSELKGTIGTGQGKLHLETHNGSISIKQ